MSKAVLIVVLACMVLVGSMFYAYMDLAHKYADLKEKYALLNETYVLKFLNYTAEYAKLRMEYETLKLNYSLLRYQYEQLSNMVNKSEALCKTFSCFSGSGKLKAEAKVYCSWFSCSVNVTVTNISNEPVGEAAVIILPYDENGTLYFIPSFHAETVENIGPGESVELEFTLIPLNVSKIEVLVVD